MWTHEAFMRGEVSHVRWLIRTDMPEMMELEESTQLLPAKEEWFLGMLRKRNCIGMCSEDREAKISGFMIYELHEWWLEILVFVARDDQAAHSLRAKLYAKINPHRRVCILWNGVSVLRSGKKEPFFLRDGQISEPTKKVIKLIPMKLRWDYLLDQGIVYD
jgi:hypothetical protein